jgi:hypothetical protein
MTWNTTRILTDRKRSFLLAAVGDVAPGDSNHPDARTMISVAVRAPHSEKLSFDHGGAFMRETRRDVEQYLRSQDAHVGRAAALREDGGRVRAHARRAELAAMARFCT